MSLRLPLKLVHRVKFAKVGASAPVLSGDAAFASQRLGDISCVDVRSGEVRWRVPSERFEPNRLLGSALVASDVGDKLRGFAANSGKVLWTLQGEIWFWRDRLMLIEPGGIKLASPDTAEVIETRPALPHTFRTGKIDGGGVRVRQDDLLVYEAEGNAFHVAYDLAKNRVLWQRPLHEEVSRLCGYGGGSVPMALAGEDLLVATFEQGLVGVSLRDGSILWHAPIVVSYFYPAALDGRIYVMRGVSQHHASGRPLENPPVPYRLVCLDATTGAVVYDVEQPALGVLEQPTRGIIHEGYIAFNTQKGLIALFRLEDGKLAWSYRYKRQGSWPVMDGNHLCVAADDGNLLIFEGAV